jgi:putative transposase
LPCAPYPVRTVADDLDLWRNRRLESGYAMVFLDSLIVRVREYELLSAKRLHLALGVLADGTKDIIGFWIDHAPAAHPWASAIDQLRGRGVVEFGIAVAENDTALIAVRSIFPSARAVRSIKHLVQESVEYLRPAARGPAAAHLLRFFVEAHPAATLADLTAQAPLRDNPVVAAFWRRNWVLAAPTAAMSPAVRDVLCTTSAVESVTEKLRRRGITKRNTFASTEAAVHELLLVLQDARASWKVSPQKWAAVRAEFLSNGRQEKPT